MKGLLCVLLTTEEASSILSVAVCNVGTVTVDNSGIVVNCGVNYSSTHLIANLENGSNGLKIVKRAQFGLTLSLIFLENL